MDPLRRTMEAVSAFFAANPVFWGLIAANAVSAAASYLPDVFLGFTVKTLEIHSMSSPELFNALINEFDKAVAQKSPYLTAELSDAKNLSKSARYASPDSAFPSNQNAPPPSAMQRYGQQVKESATQGRPVDYKLGYGSWVLKFRAKVTSNLALGDHWYLQWTRAVDNSTISVPNRVAEKLILRCVNQRWPELDALVKRAAEAHEKRGRDLVRIYTSMGNGRMFQLVAERPLVRMADVVLANGVSSDVLNHVAWFFSNEGRNFYRDEGLRYRLGLLFYGVPGSGKSSLAFALASEFRLSIYFITLSSDDINDQSLSELFSKVPAYSIILLEDIDAALSARQGQHRVTASGLFNALDGVISYEGCILIMTTNHRERLDNALIRDGRVDKQIEFKAPTLAQIREYLVNKMGDHISRCAGGRETAIARIMNSGFVNSMARLRTLLTTVERSVAVENLSVDAAIDVWIQAMHAQNVAPPAPPAPNIAVDDEDSMDIERSDEEDNRAGHSEHSRQKKPSQSLRPQHKQLVQALIRIYTMAGSRSPDLEYEIREGSLRGMFRGADQEGVAEEIASHLKRLMLWAAENSMCLDEALLLELQEQSGLIEFL